MNKLYFSPTITTPEVILSPEENIFRISGISSPEDVRKIYYPISEWIREFINEVIAGNDRLTTYTAKFPFILRIDLTYFNSSSAKFLYDIFIELKRFEPAHIPFIVEWVYEEEDIDLKEAGIDIASIAEMEFSYIAK